jgi:hypothetical protein
MSRCPATRVLRFLALESAGQCGPCLNGLPRIAATFVESARPGCPPGLRTDIQRWAGLVGGRGACHHPDGTVRLVRSALTTFALEADRHVRGECTAADHTPLLPVPRPEGNCARSAPDGRASPHSAPASRDGHTKENPVNRLGIATVAATAFGYFGSNRPDFSLNWPVSRST